MNRKYASPAFNGLRKQILAIAHHETILATFAGDDFLDLFCPVAKFLSESTARTYIDYLIEAKNMILQGKSEMETYEYFVSEMQHLQEDKQ